ncbi:MAG: hypothetical protein ACK4GW_14920 [Pseudorhodobacter sp.]
MTDDADPKGLIRESYLIEGISPGECRSILVDWALSLGPSMPAQSAIALLIERHAASNPGHPMNPILAEGLRTAPDPKRRGGRSGRVLT